MPARLYTGEHCFEKHGDLLRILGKRCTIVTGKHAAKESGALDDITAALKNDPAALENYLKFPEPYKRIRVAYIEAARKRPEEFRKRLGSFIEKTRKGKMITGYGGIETYYEEIL
jgi:hypothetical protein